MVAGEEQRPGGIETLDVGDGDEVRSSGAPTLADQALAAVERPDVRYGVGAALGVLAFLIFVGILYPAPVSILFLGAVLGALSAMVAMGIVLVYRANRIINFAQGELGAVAAILAASLIVGPGWGFWPAVGAGFLLAIVLGAGTELLIIRRFAAAPRLILTVATIGIAQVFAFVELGLPRLFDYDVVPQPPVPFDLRWKWSPVVFNGGHILIMITVPIVVIALGAFFRFTRIGIAVRAAAESSDRAALLGIPVKRLQTVVWVLAAALSGMGVLLRLPIQGVSIGAVLGPSLLLRALAAAVIGRMERLPVTFAAAMVIGILEQAVLFQTGRTLVVDGVLFFLILGALLFQRRGIVARAEAVDVSSWSATKEVRPIPRELRADPVVRWGLRGLGAIGLVVLLVLPLQLRSSQVNLVSIGLILAMVAVSLAVLTGWAGQISLGQMAFAAFGAAVAGTLAQDGHGFFVCIAAAGLTGAAVAVLIGIPALRIQGLFLAVSTLAFALATGSFFINREFFPWLVPVPAQRISRPVLFDKYDLESDVTFYYMLLIVFFVVIGAVRSLRNSRSGRVLVATRDNVRAAQAYGVNPVRARLTAFSLSGFIAATAGGLFLFHQYDVPRSVTQADSSLLIFSMSVIGGLGSLPGAVLGAGYLTFLDFSPFTRQPLSRLLASGVGMLLILMFIPGGLGGLLYEARDAILRVIARARGIVVPSLLADVRVDEDAPAAPGGPATAGRFDAVRGAFARLGSRLSRSGAERATDAAGSGNLLEVRDVDVAYGRTQVLFGVDFHVRRGEIVALLGTNGAGKSTLLSAISGLVPPTRGSITYDGADITDVGPNATVAAGIVFMPGGKGVFPNLTVEENLKLAAWLFVKEPEYVAQATAQVLEYFPILERRWEQKAGNLSGGEQQMLTLGQAFIARPKLLMIDELSLGLAPVIVEQLLDIVRAIHANGTTVILVEQSVNVAITLAQRAVFMEKGEVRFDGPTADLLSRPDILRAVFLKGSAAADAARDGAPEESNGKVRPAFIAQCATCGHEHRPVLEVHDISVGFGGVKAVSDVSLDIREGQILGIIGPNGAGKTTVFDLISGYLTSEGGRILLDGEDVTGASPDHRAALGLGRSFQDARLFPSMTVRQTISVAFERHIPHRDPIATVMMSGAVRHAEKDLASKVDALIEQMNLTAFADKFIGELSTGTRRIVDLACSLAHDPKILLLDEPSSGIAQRETEALGPVLLDIRDRTGAALIVIEHDMPLITSISDELIALELGSVVTRGTPDEVINDQRVVEGYLGGSEEVIFRSGSGPAARAPTRRRRRTTGVAR